MPSLSRGFYVLQLHLVSSGSIQQVKSAMPANKRLKDLLTETAKVCDVSFVNTRISDVSDSTADSYYLSSALCFLMF